MTDQDRADFLWRALSACKELKPEITIATVTHWLEHHGAGFPDTPLMQERIRSDAKFWAAAATQDELEAYVVAAVIEMERSLVTEKTLKRLAALAWKNMNIKSREGFRNWIGEK